MHLLLALAIFLAPTSPYQASPVNEGALRSSLSIDIRGQANWHDASAAKWNTTTLEAANGYREYQERLFRARLARLHRSGAETVRISDFHRPASILPSYLDKVDKYRGDLFRGQQLIGFSSSGNKVAKVSWGPVDASDLTSYLFWAKTGTCRLGGISWLNPNTWFVQNCDLNPVTSEDILQAALFTHLSVPGAKNAFDEKIQELDWIFKNRVPFEIRSGAIYCPQLRDEFASPSNIPLKYQEFGVKYRISFRSQKWSAIFKQVGPDIQAVANHIKLERDSMGRRFLTPFSTYWRN